MIVRKIQKVHTLEITPRVLMNTVAIQLEHAVFQGNVYLQRKLNVLLAMACTTVMEISAQLSIAMTVQQI